MRIFDRIASGENVHQAGKDVNVHRDIAWRKTVNESVRLVADEAAQHVYWSDRSDWDVDSGRFGLQVPMFRRMWIEWTTPRTRCVRGKWHQVQPSRNASVLECQDGDDGVLHVSMRHITTWDDRPLVVLPLSTNMVLSADRQHAVARNSFDEEGMEALGIGGQYAGMSNQQKAAGLAIEYWPGHMALGLANWPKSRLMKESATDGRSRKKSRRGTVSSEYLRLTLPTSISTHLAANRDAERRGVKFHAVSGYFRQGGKYVEGYWRGDARLGVINKEYHVTAEAAQ